MNYTDIITQDQRIARETVSIANMLDGMLAMIISRHQAIFERIWFNKNGLTPQEVLDGYGIHAAKLFHDSAALVEFVNFVVPGIYLPVVPYQFTINDDGTVTVGDFIDSSSDSSSWSSQSRSESSESSVSEVI